MLNVPRQLPVLIGLLVSLVAHAWLFVPMLDSMLRNPTSMPAANVSLSPKPVEESVDPRLGLQQSRATTLAWVGYEEYEQHLARLSEQDQAAFELDPGLPTPLSRQPTPPSPTSPTSTAQTTPSSLQSVIASMLQQMMRQPNPDTATDQPAALPRSTTRRLPDIDTTIALPAPAETSPTARADAEPSDAPARPAAPGDTSDKQSDPTSTIEAPLDDIRLGKPLAAAGLELFPRRPEFTTLQRMSAWPANPLCLIQFDSTGTPRHASLIEGTGDPRIDQALLASLYRWRAEGKPLTQVEDDATVDIAIRIVLR